MTSSQNYLREKRSAAKTNKIAIWASSSATKIKLNCSLLYVVGYSETCIKRTSY